jgi:hypothetical protein
MARRDREPGTVFADTHKGIDIREIGAFMTVLRNSIFPVSMACQSVLAMEDIVRARTRFYIAYHVQYLWIVGIICRSI